MNIKKTSNYLQTINIRNVAKGLFACRPRALESVFTVLQCNCAKNNEWINKYVAQHNNNNDNNNLI